ncbi:hypothetical protein NBRC116494_21420 [Aurantivibrio plasticivorans]
MCVEDDALGDFMKSRFDNFLVTTDQLSDWDQTEIFEVNSGKLEALELWAVFEDFSRFAVDGYMESFSDTLPSDKDAKGFDILYVLDDGHLDELNEFEYRWESFNRSVRHGMRFFNKEAKEFCDDLFAGMFESDELAESVVREVALDTSIYRARIAFSKSELKEISKDPVKQLCSVPSELAGSQRMTPAGVSAFYGAFDRDTCVSELRPLVGDAVVSAEFRPNRALKLLDLNALADMEPPSDVFAENYQKQAHARAFFKELVFQLSRPSRRGDQHDYLATQVIFEYLRTKVSKQVNGIKYSSVQNDGEGQCISLFPEYSGVNDGFVELNENPFDLLKPENALFCVPDSLKFFRVESASYDGSQYDDSYVLMADDRMLKLLFPSERY